MQDNNRLIAHLFALGTTIVWGTTFISSKILLESLTPSEIIVYRFAIAIAFLYLLRPHFFRHGRGWRMEAAFAGAGLSGVSVYFLFENTALTYTYASNVGVIICTAPFFTGLASAIVFRDKLQGNFFWGFLVAMVGICLISFNDVSVLQLNPLGDFLALMAAASWAIYSICTRFIFKYGYPLLEVTRRIFIWGLISLIFFLPFQDEVWSMPDLANISILGNLLFLGILASGVCFATWNYALRVLGPIKTTAYIYLTPVITVAASVIFLGEHITLLAAFGIGLALAGLLLSENRFTLPDVLKEYGSRGLGLSSPDNSLIKALKAIHLLSATAWAGGALSMQALSFLKISTADPAVREQIAYCLHFIDTVVVIPGLCGCALTGLFYSLFTALGFFRYAWIGFKWLITLCAAFWGTMFWGPWGDYLIARLAEHGWDFPVRFIKAFILPQSMWQGAMQLGIILVMCLISVYRPTSFRHWKKTEK